MTGLERVRRAVHFEGPDRVPHLLPDGKPNDLALRMLPGPETGRTTSWRQVDGERWQRSDEWGSTWQRFGPSGKGEVVKPVLAGWDRLDELLGLLATPPPAEPIAQYRADIAADAEGHYHLGHLPYPSLFAQSHALHGLSNLLVDLYESPERVERLLDRLADSQVMCVDLIASTGAHGIMGADDWGTQDRPLISPALWRRFFAPRYRRVWQHAHARGLDVWLHSCGYILPLLPDMIECGLNVIQMDQQENMGLAELDRAVGGRLAFWCPVDIQQTMVHGSVADVEAYVRKMIYHLGRHDGGFVSKAYPTPQDVGHTPEKTAAMCAAFRRWGVYPLALDL